MWQAVWSNFFFSFFAALMGEKELHTRNRETHAGFRGAQARNMAKTYPMQLLYSRFLMTMPPRQCLLPSLCGECFPGCLLPSLCGECIGIALGFGTHGFGFGHCLVGSFVTRGAAPCRTYLKKHGGTELRNKTQRNATQSKARESKERKKAPFCLLLEPGKSSRQ